MAKAKKKVDAGLVARVTRLWRGGEKLNAEKLAGDLTAADLPECVGIFAEKRVEN